MGKFGCGVREDLWVEQGRGLSFHFNYDQWLVLLGLRPYVAFQLKNIEALNYAARIHLSR